MPNPKTFSTLLQFILPGSNTGDKEYDMDSVATIYFANDTHHCQFCHTEIIALHESKQYKSIKSRHLNG